MSSILEILSRKCPVFMTIDPEVLSHENQVAVLSSPIVLSTVLLHGFADCSLRRTRFLVGIENRHKLVHTCLLSESAGVIVGRWLAHPQEPGAWLYTKAWMYAHSTRTA